MLTREHTCAAEMVDAIFPEDHKSTLAPTIGTCNYDDTAKRPLPAQSLWRGPYHGTAYAHSTYGLAHAL